MRARRCECTRPCVWACFAEAHQIAHRLLSHGIPFVFRLTSTSFFKGPVDEGGVSCPRLPPPGRSLDPLGGGIAICKAVPRPEPSVAAAEGEGEVPTPEDDDDEDLGDVNAIMALPSPEAVLMGEGGGTPFRSLCFSNHLRDVMCGFIPPQM